MLFLAVFCGFLAEYQLEHVIENQREKKYIRSLLGDLKKDTADLRSDIRWWNELSVRIDTIHQELYKAPGARNLPLLYRQVGYMRMYNAFEYHDRTIDQLKNAGNFRLLRKQNVADSLIDYDAMIKSTLRNIESGGNTIFMTTNFMQNKIFDSRFFHLRANTRMLDSLLSAQDGILDINQVKKEDLFEYINHLHFYKGNTRIRLVNIGTLLKKAETLIGMIREEYGVE